jgi:3-hydroxybutyryl-CoA dehydrogenase
MDFTLVDTGNSRSFPVVGELAAKSTAGAGVVLIVGVGAGEAYEALAERNQKTAVLIELGSGCLGVHTGEARGDEGGNAVGFARFRFGDENPTALVELVRQPRTSAAALAAATAVFESMGLKVAVCGDFAGRIIDRLVRPYYNAALQKLDEGLATADDLDTTLKLGLGYPEGPISLLERTGLAHHHDVTQALYEAYGESPYAPARRARVAKRRQQLNTKDTKETGKDTR